MNSKMNSHEKAQKAQNQNFFCAFCVFPNHYDAFSIDAAYPLTPALSPIGNGARENRQAVVGKITDPAIRIG